MTNSTRNGRSKLDFPQTEVGFVIGANDVTNPCRPETTRTAPFYGNAHSRCGQARTVMVIKRSMNPGSPASTMTLLHGKTLMLFGDAKEFTAKLIKEISANHG